MGQVNDRTGGTLVIHRGALGDLLGIVPTLQALRRRFPSDPITLLSHAEPGTLLRHCGAIDELYDVNKAAFVSLFSERQPNEKLAAWLATFKRAVAWIKDPDAVVEDVFAAVGVPHAIVAPPFCDPGNPKPHSKYLADTVAELELDVTIPAQTLALDEQDRADAAAWLAGRGVDTTKPIVAVHPGSGSPSKQWSPAAFLQVASTLRDTGAVQVIVVLGPAEVDEDSVAYDWIGASNAVAAMLPLPLLAGVATRCAVWIGNDTGTTHLAAMLGVPTIALFGKASNQFIWAPQGRDVTILSATCGLTATPRPDEVRKVLEIVRGHLKGAPR